MGQAPPDQILCQHCRGGNPRSATVCMWCGHTIAAHAPDDNQSLPAADPEEVEKVRAKVEQVLMQGEKIEYIAVESKPIQVNIAPDCVVLTNRRFIMYRPRAFGRVDFEDYIWRDLHDARINEGILRATSSVETTQGKHIEVSDLPKEQARRVYQFAQQMEEYVLEERRNRELEEKRAASGGIYMQTPVAPVIPSFQAAQPGAQP